MRPCCIPRSRECCHACSIAATGTVVLKASSALWQDDKLNKPIRDFFEMVLKLVIGNKNYSSWSMRPWLALRNNNIAFDEVFIPLYTGDADKKRILSFPHSGKVPALIDGDVTIWDSLAIIEYLAEGFPHARLWPEDRARRAHARSISAEMHSGFVALRTECGMNLHRPVGAIT